MIEWSKLEIEPAGPWWPILDAWRKGKKIDKRQVIELLESGEQIPVAANALIAAAVDRDKPSPFQRGNKAWYDADLSPELIAQLVDALEARIKDPKIVDNADSEQRHWLQKAHRRAMRKRGESMTARRQAIEHVAWQLDMSTRHIEKAITERNKKNKKRCT